MSKETAEQDDIPESPRARQAKRGRLFVSAAILAPLVVLGIIVWGQRISIANAIGDGVLKERGVTGGWTATSLDLNGAELRNVSIGDPAKPTLTAPFVRIRWRADILSGKAIITSIEADRPVLRVGVTKNKLDLGALAPFLKGGGGPSPIDLQNATIRRATVFVQTPQGLSDVVLDGSGSMKAGWKGQGTASLPEQLRVSGQPVARIPFSVSFANQTASLSLEPSNLSLALPAASLAGLTGNLKADIQLGTPTGGPIRIKTSGAVSVDRAEGYGFTGNGLALNAADLGLEIPRSGLAQASMTLDATLRATRLAASSPQATWVGRGISLALTGDRRENGAAALRLNADVSSAQWADVALSQLSGATELSGTLHALTSPASFVGGGRVQLIAREAAMSAAAAARITSPLRALAAAGGPASAYAGSLATALTAAARGARVNANGRLALNGTTSTAITLDRPVTLGARSGMTITATGPGDWLTYSLPKGLLKARGSLALKGGGLPDATIALSSLTGQNGTWAWTGNGKIAPWSAGGGNLGLTLARLDGLATSQTAQLNLSGVTQASGQFGAAAIGDSAARFNVSVRRNGASTTVRSNKCTDFAVNNVASDTLSAPRFAGKLCPDQAGRLFAAAGPQQQIFGSLALEPITAKLGTGTEAQTISIGASRITAEPTRTGIATRVSLPSVDIVYPLANGGASNLSWSQAGGVLRSDRQGGWLFDGSVTGFAATGLPVTLKGDAEGQVRLGKGEISAEGRALSLLVTDAEKSPRFAPVTLKGTATLANGKIAGDFAATLVEDNRRLGAVTLSHTLNAGAGSVEFDGDGLVFARDELQPSAIVPPLRGVIANVDGKVDAKAKVAWQRGQPLSSTGLFTTSALNLATSLGPMTNVGGSLEMTDLLGLVSAPAQKITVGTFNPGIPIETGVVDFSLPGGGKIAIKDARWPLADGEVYLEPVLWTIGAPRQTVTLDLSRIDLQRLLGLMNVPDLEMEGRVSGVFPVEIADNTARIVNGRLQADEKGGVIRFRNAAMTETAKSNQGTKLAFDALENFLFRILEIRVDGAVTGELTLGLLFEGRNPTVLYGTPFRFDVNAIAPFAQLFRSANNMFDSGATLRLLRDQVKVEPPVQTPASENPTPPVDPVAPQAQPQPPTRH